MYRQWNIQEFDQLSNVCKLPIWMYALGARTLKAIARYHSSIFRSSQGLSPPAKCKRLCCLLLVPSLVPNRDRLARLANSAQWCCCMVFYMLKICSKFEDLNANDDCTFRCASSDAEAIKQEEKYGKPEAPSTLQILPVHNCKAGTWQNLRHYFVWWAQISDKLSGRLSTCLNDLPHNDIALWKHSSPACCSSQPDLPNYFVLISLP